MASVLVSSQTHSPEDRESEFTTAQKEVPETAPEVPAGPGDPVAAGCCRLLPMHGNGAARHGAVLWKVAGSALCSPKERTQSSSQQQRDSGFCQHAHTVLSIAPFLEMLETALKHTQVLSRNTNLLRFWVVLWALSVEFYSNAKGGRLTHSQSEIGSRNPVFWARLQLLSILVSIPKVPATAICLSPASPLFLIQTPPSFPKADAEQPPLPSEGSDSPQHFTSLKAKHCSDTL